MGAEISTAMMAVTADVDAPTRSRRPHRHGDLPGVARETLSRVSQSDLVTYLRNCCHSLSPNFEAISLVFDEYCIDGYVLCGVGTTFDELESFFQGMGLLADFPAECMMLKTLYQRLLYDPSWFANALTVDSAKMATGSTTTTATAASAETTYGAAYGSTDATLRTSIRCQPRLAAGENDLRASQQMTPMTQFQRFPGVQTKAATVTAELVALTTKKRRLRKQQCTGTASPDAENENTDIRSEKRASRGKTMKYEDYLYDGLPTDAANSASQQSDAPRSKALKRPSGRLASNHGAATSRRSITMAQSNGVPPKRSTSYGVVVTTTSNSSVNPEIKSVVSLRINSAVTYTGDVIVVDGKVLRHGFGSSTHAKMNCLFEGNYLYGKRCGDGEQRFTNGDRIVGTWNQLSVHYEGVFHYSNGDRYEGFFKGLSRHGKGAMYWKNGDVYIGHFYLNLRSGGGTMHWKSGAVYRGRWDKDEPVDPSLITKLQSTDGVAKVPMLISHCKAKANIGHTASRSTKVDHEIDGHRWVKKKVESVRIGRSVRYSGDAILVKGKLLRHGFGSSKDGPGQFTYTGNYYKDKRHGDGEMLLANGDRIVGTWDRQSEVYDAIVFYSNGDHYEGRLKGFVKHGRGVMRWKNGDVYTGPFRGDLRSGKGKMQWESGVVYKGRWEHDKPVDPAQISHVFGNPQLEATIVHSTQSAVSANKVGESINADFDDSATETDSVAGSCSDVRSLSMSCSDDTEDEGTDLEYDLHATCTAAAPVESAHLLMDNRVNHGADCTYAAEALI